MSYRSKRTRALMNKENEPQENKKQQTEGQIGCEYGGTGTERWGPFCPLSDGASHLHEPHRIDKGQFSPKRLPLSNSEVNHIHTLNVTSTEKCPMKSSTIQPPPMLHKLRASAKLVSLSKSPGSEGTKGSGGTKTSESNSQQLLSQLHKSSSSTSHDSFKVPFPTTTAPIWKNPLNEPSTTKLPVRTPHQPQPRHDNRRSSTSHVDDSLKNPTVRNSPMMRKFFSVEPSKANPSIEKTKSQPQPEIGRSSNTHVDDSHKNLQSKSAAPIWKSSLHESSTESSKSKSKIVHKISSNVTDDVNVALKAGKPLEVPQEENSPKLSTRNVMSNGSNQFKPRRRSLVPEWPDDVEFDEKEKVLTIDAEGEYEMVSGLIQPHDIWHANGVKNYVTFNEFNQPLKKGGHILIRFLGDVAKTERFCPIREIN